jgi:hypothetical protein
MSEASCNINNRQLELDLHQLETDLGYFVPEIQKHNGKSCGASLGAMTRTEFFYSSCIADQITLFPIEIGSSFEPPSLGIENTFGNISVLDSKTLSQLPCLQRLAKELQILSRKS